jgi:hypothetical protein
MLLLSLSAHCEHDPLALTSTANYPLKCCLRYSCSSASQTTSYTNYNLQLLHLQHPTHTLAHSTHYNTLYSEQVVDAYSNSTKRILLFDYGGTLLEKEGLGKYLKRDSISSVSGRRLNARTEAGLTALCADPRNTVFVVSGLHPKGLLDAVGHIPR